MPASIHVYRRRKTPCDIWTTERLPGGCGVSCWRDVAFWTSKRSFSAELSAQFTWCWMQFIYFFSDGGIAENALHFLKCTCSSNSFSSILGGLFVCLLNAQLAVRNWTFQLSGGWWQMSPSSAPLTAVAVCDSQGQVSALEKKGNVNSCDTVFQEKV